LAHIDATARRINSDNAYVRAHNAGRAMKTKKSEDRLCELCERALSETDPDKLLILFREINEMLLKHILQVQQVVERQRELEKSFDGPPQ
jgi:hypothetical protein